jgi:hypothetical protein
MFGRQWPEIWPEVFVDSFLCALGSLAASGLLNEQRWSLTALDDFRTLVSAHNRLRVQIGGSQPPVLAAVERGGVIGRGPQVRGMSSAGHVLARIVRRDVLVSEPDPFSPSCPL